MSYWVLFSYQLKENQINLRSKNSIYFNIGLVIVAFLLSFLIFQIGKYLFFGISY